MLSAKVGGRWLASIGAHGPITVEYGRHGAEAASWEMNADLRHQLLRGNVSVDIYDGGTCVWPGTLVEPSSDGKYMARGLWHQAETTYALDGVGDMTSNPYDAIAWARDRGDLTWGSDWTTFPYAAWGSPTEPMRLSELLDAYTAEQGTRWYVAADKNVYHAADPTTPKWVVPHAVAGRGLTPAEDEFFTHLAGRYKDAGGVYRTTIVGSADAAAVFGRRLELVDLADLGNTTSTRAIQVLTGMLLKSGARMGWGEGLELGYGQIATPGGTPAALNQIASLQMVRLNGTVDTSRPYLLRGYTDIVLDSVKYTDGAKTITLTPMGYAPRTLGDALEEAMADA